MIFKLLQFVFAGCISLSVNYWTCCDKKT